VPLLNVALVPAPDRVVVRLTGDVDLSCRPLLVEGLARAARLAVRHVLVDVAAARFWDCSGLRVLSEFTADLAEADRACRVVGAPAITRRLVSVAGLDDLLQLDGPVDLDSARTGPGAERAGADRRTCVAPRFPVRCESDLVPGEFCTPTGAG
jgi:anti-anti-sigma factor